jgi:hypothetical protein
MWLSYKLFEIVIIVKKMYLRCKKAVIFCYRRLTYQSKILILCDYSSCIFMPERFNWAQQIRNQGTLNSADVSVRSSDFQQGTPLDYEGKARQVFLDAVDELRSSSTDLLESGILTLATEAADDFIRESNTTYFKQALDLSAAGQPYVTPDTTRAYRKTEREYKKRLEQLESEQERVNEASSGEEVPDIEERYASRKQNLIYEH